MGTVYDHPTRDTELPLFRPAAAHINRPSGNPAKRRVWPRVFVFPLVIAGMELLLLRLALPDARQTANLLQASPATTHSSYLAELPGAPDFLTPLLDPRELEIGQFQASLTSTHPPLAIEIHLIGLVEAQSVPRATHLLKTHRHRLRQEMLAMLRALDPHNLAESELDLLKRQILEKTNRALGAPLFHELVISDLRCRRE